MSRIRTTLFALLIPAALAGGLVATTFADDDDDARQDEREARGAAREAEAEARQAEREARDAAKGTRKAAKKQVQEARRRAVEQLDTAREQIRLAPLPARLRDRLLARLDQIANSVGQHLDRAGDGSGDFEADMERMGEEIEAEMEEMAKEFEKMGEDFAKNFDGKDWSFDPGDVDMDNFVPPVPPVPPVAPVAPRAPLPPRAAASGIDVDVDMSDLDLVIDVDNLALGADQIEALHLIFEDEQRVVEPAREALDDAAEVLREALDNPDIDEREVGKMVDEISEQEARIRKAQILAWVKTRSVLDDRQRDRVEKAKVKRKVRARRVDQP